MNKRIISSCLLVVLTMITSMYWCEVNRKWNSQNQITVQIEKIHGIPLIREEIIIIKEEIKTVKREVNPTLNNNFNKNIFDNLNSGFKAYMDYRKITNKSSDQWKMQQQATTDSEGFRIYDERYMIALGTRFAPVCGIKLKITLSSGKVIKAISGDVKSNKHTDNTNTFMLTDKSVVEFIVDTNKISKTSKKMGNMSYSGLQGEIIAIEKES